MFSLRCRLQKNNLHSVFFLILFAIDQLSKYWAFTTSRAQLNTGISFGYGAALAPVVLLVVSTSMVIVSIWAFADFWKQHRTIALFFFAGAISNMFDRLLYGAVIDWMYVPFFALQNNFADYYIVLSVLGVLYVLNSNKKENHYDHYL